MLAQGTARFYIETSLDGTTWAEGVRDVSRGATVLVRNRVSFDVPGAIGYAGSQYDIEIRNTGPGDIATDLVRPTPFDFAPQTVVARRFGTSIGIDDSRDTLGPGLGTRGITPGQGVAAFSPNFSYANPVTIFTFALTVDQRLGQRDFRITNTNPTGFPLDRMIRVYTNPNGGQATPFTTVDMSTRINVVIPAPASLGVGLVAIGVCARRRR
ncbi:MAG: hypothetical protein SFZ23_04610 [Planctomycetota bacterium]|nr:hypothetical protein [Planctomycetota bacterium]